MYDPLAARLGIIETLHRYCHLFDEGDPQQLRELFHDDVIFFFDDDTGRLPVAGIEAVCRMLSERRSALSDIRRRHMVVNTVFEEESPNKVRTCSYLLLTSMRDRELEVVDSGIYRDVFLNSGRMWKIAERRLSLDTRTSSSGRQE